MEDPPFSSHGIAGSGNFISGSEPGQKIFCGFFVLSNIMSNLANPVKSMVHRIT
jgi:hypothetical protein